MELLMLFLLLLVLFRLLWFPLAAVLRPTATPSSLAEREFPRQS